MIGVTLDSAEIEAGVTKHGILFRFVLPLQSIDEYKVGKNIIIGIPASFIVDLLNQFDKYDEFDNACVADIYDITDVKGYGKTLFVKFPSSCSHEKHDDDKVIYTVVVTWVNLVTRLLEMI